jgi:hypothetical protein
MAQRGTGFVSINDYLDANQGTLDNERASLQGLVGGEYAGAQGAADQLIANAVPGQGDYTTMPGYSAALDSATKANQDAASLGTYGGVSDLIARRFGANQDQANFDANLVGTMQAPGSDLTNYLNTGLRFATETPGPQTASTDRNVRPHGPRPDEPPPDDGQPGWYHNPADMPQGPEDAPPPPPWWDPDYMRNEGGG